MQVGKMRVRDDQRISTGQHKHGVMADLLERVQYRLARGKAKIPEIDAIPALEILDGVSSGAEAKHERIVARTSSQMVFAFAADQEIAAVAALQVVIATTSSKSVIAVFAEKGVLAFA